MNELRSSDKHVFSFNSSSKRQRIAVLEPEAQPTQVELVTVVQDWKVSGNSLEVKQDLVIPLIGNDKPRSDVDTDKRKQAPLLRAHLAPELLCLENEDERFRVDMKLRADDVNFKSESFVNVPVEQFGAALLRGMGYRDTNDLSKHENDTGLEARENRLGLGAMSKLSNNSKKLIKVNNDSKSAKPVQVVFSKKQLLDGDVVKIVDETLAQFNRRAIVVKARGVPGLDMVRVQLEDDSTVIDVRKKALEKVSEEELRAKSFVNPIPAVYVDTISGKELQTREDSVQYFGSREVRLSSISTKPSKPESQEKLPAKNWLRSGIRVKIVSRKLAGDLIYLQKATVVDVPSIAVASIRLDNGKVIQHAHEKYLETIVPSVGSQCLVLNGKHRGELAIISEKQKSHQQVVVQLSDDLSYATLGMDDVAAIHRNT